jgi:hypothetical protein
MIGNHVDSYPGANPEPRSRPKLLATAAVLIEITTGTESGAQRG